MAARNASYRKTKEETSVPRAFQRVWSNALPILRGNRINYA